MLKNIDLTSILFIDIECVSQTAHFKQLSPALKEAWEKKSEALQKGAAKVVSPEQYYEEKAAIYSEFGKIICISVGKFSLDKSTNQYHFFVKSYFGHDESSVLQEFGEAVNRHFKRTTPYDRTPKFFICGHNIKEFDVPYICRRMLLNRMELPEMLNISARKPWEIAYMLDTMEMWSFGDKKAFTSLSLLCAAFDIPTPKDDIDGSQVGKVYWLENDLERIEKYCKKDVIATAQLVLQFRREPLLTEEFITFLS